MLDLPKNWSEVRLWQYQELFEIEQTDMSSVELSLEQLAILMNTDTEDEIFEDLDTEELFNAVKSVQWMKSNPKNTFDLKIDNLVCKDPNKLLLGEFIDVEHYIKDFVANFHLILAIFYKKTDIDKWGNTEWEPHIYDVSERSEMFKEMPVTRVYGAIERYLKWKEDFMDSYVNLFEDPKFDEIDDAEEIDAHERAEMMKEIQADKKKARWSWETMLWNLSGGDVTKYDALFKIPVILIFNTLSMKKDLNV